VSIDLLPGSEIAGKSLLEGGRGKGEKGERGQGRR